MKNSISLLFYLKRAKITAESTVPVYLRITVGGQRIEISSKRYVNPDKWNTSAQKLSGSSEDVKSLNAHLKNLELQVYEVYYAMIDQRVPVTATGLKSLLTCNEEAYGSLPRPIQRHTYSSGSYKLTCTAYK